MLKFDFSTLSEKVLEIDFFSSFIVICGLMVVFAKPESINA